MFECAPTALHLRVERVFRRQKNDGPQPEQEAGASSTRPWMTPADASPGGSVRETGRASAGFPNDGRPATPSRYNHISAHNPSVRAVHVRRGSKTASLRIGS